MADTNLVPTEWLAWVRERIRQTLAAPVPETPAEHLKNAEQLLLNVVTEHPIIRHTCPEIDAARLRIRRALEALAGSGS